MKSNLTIISCALLLLAPVFLKGQNMVYKEATIARPAEFWKPFLLPNGTNIENGVSFYSTEAACVLRTSKLLKLINTNPYAVLISYQLFASDSTVNVTIPASISIEGVCDTSDKNIAKLIFKPTLGKDENGKTDVQQFKLSNISVSKFK